MFTYQVIVDWQQFNEQVCDWGKLPTGEMVHKITFGYRIHCICFIMNRNGDMSVSIIDYGAAIQSVKMKGKSGEMEVIL